MRRILSCLVLAGGLALPAQAGVITADYTTLSNTAAGGVPSLTLAGTTVTGSANVTVGTLAGFRGVGVVGGGDDLSLDLGETLTINYGQLVTDVTLRVVDIAPPGNVSYRFEAFNGATSLGIFNIPPHVTGVQNNNLTALDGGLPFTRIQLSITASAPLGLQIQDTTFTPAAATPEPLSIAVFGGLVGVGGLVARRRVKA